MKVKINTTIGLFKTTCLPYALRILLLFLFFAANQVTAQSVSIGATQPNADETGPVNGEFTIKISGAVPSTLYTIDLIDAGSTAIMGVDYTAISPLQVQFMTDPSGDGGGTILIDVTDDNFVEPTENVVLTITNTTPALTIDTAADEVEIMDNDVAGVVVNTTTGTTTEAGVTATFTFSLTSEPTAAVTIPISQYDPTETSGPTQVVINPADWNTGVNLVITGANDAIVDGNIVNTIDTGDVTSLDQNYDDLGAADVAQLEVTNMDDDTAGIIITPNTTLATTEPNGSATFTVALTGGPVSPVVLDISSSNTGEATVSPATLTFSTTNYNTPQTVTVTGQDDAIVDGPQPYDITIAVDDTQSALSYHSLADQTISGSNADNDTAGIIITESGTNTVTSEPNGIDTFTLALSAEPQSNVTLTVSSSDTGEATVSPAAVTFTPTNYANPQTITVTGANDALVDGPQNVTITVAVDDATSDDDFDPIPDQLIAVVNNDDDKFIASLTADNPTAAESTPANQGGNFRITLDQINNTGAPVIVNFSLSGTAAAGDYASMGASASIADGSQDVSVAVTPTDDNEVENTETVIMTLVAGTGYTVAPTPNNTGTVTITDNDDFTVSVTATDNDAAEDTPANSTGIFTIDLGAPNNLGSPVTVNYTMSGPAVEGTDYTALTGSVDIPNGQQTDIVTITPTDDLIMEGAETAVITLAAGTNYIFGTPPTITATVTIADNDQATLSIANKAINENDPTGVLELDVTLDIAVVGGTTVSYTFSDDTATGGGVDYAGIMPPNNVLTFAGNAGEVQTISFTIVDDQVIENTETFNVQLGTPTNSVLLDDGNAVGTINDDDNCVAAPILDTTVSTLFCDVIDRSLNEYTSSVPPTGTTLMWSRSSQALNENAYLLPAEVNNPPNAGSYYGFFLDDNGTPTNFNDDCASGIIEVEIVLNISPILTETDVTDAERCEPGTLLLSASPSAGASINWYETIGAVTPIFTGDDFTTPVLNATRSYYAEAIENGCKSERQEVVATIGIQKTTGTATNGSICNVAINGPTEVDLDDRLVGADNGAWTVKTDPSGSIVLTSENTIDFTGLASGDYVFTFTTIGSTAPCVDETVDVTISVSDCETDDDNDGLLGGQEAILGTDATNPDTDGDGIEDGVEVGPDVTNPLDEDKDGIIDALDSNTNDTDSDGVNDQQDPANENPCIPDNSSVDCPVDLELAKSASSLDAAAGDEIVFTVTVHNLTDKLVDDAVVGDLIETGFQYVSHTTVIGSYDETTGQWVIEDLAALGTATLEITVLVQEEGVHTNTAELLSSTPLDENPDNDTATVTIETQVIEGVDLVVVKKVDKITPLEGDQITFTIEVTNLSEFEDVINTIIVKDSITSGAENLFSYVSHSPSTADYDDLTGIWTIPSLAFGEENTITLEITGTVTLEGSFNNTASIVSSSPRDSKDDSNNESTVTVDVGVPTPADPGFLFNMFSPNGDGTNDVLSINLRDEASGNDYGIRYKLNIFDRYGNLVFEGSTEVAAGIERSADVWDGTYKGKEVPKGTYFYILEYTLIEVGIQSTAGNQNSIIIDKGWIQLIR